MSAFYKSPEELRRETLFQCSSGNCTFEPFVTVGICHRCKDVTSDLREMPGSYDELLNTIIEYRTSNSPGIKVGGPGFYATGYSLPNGHFIANTDGCRPYQNIKCRSKSYATTSFGTGNPNKTVAMKDIDTLLWSLSIIYADISALKAAKALYSTNESPEVTWPTVPLKALECALYYCGKFVNSTVLNGRLKENITDIAGKRDKHSWASSNQFIDDSSDLLPEYRAPPDEIRSLEFHKLWSVARYQPLTIILNSKEQVTIQANSIKSIGAYIQGLFRWEPWFNNTKVRTELSRLPGMENAVGFNGASFGPVKDLLAIAQPPALNKLVSTSRSDFAGIARVFESMAMSMTNEIRRTNQEADIAHNGMNTMKGKGLVGSTVVLYEVKWPWIALHVAILVLACTLLLVTIIESKSSAAVPLWKSSSLAALRHGHDIGGLFNDSDKSVAGMENTARKTYMSGRQIDVEGTKHSGEQYAGLVESRRASQTYLDDEGMDSSTTDIACAERQLGNSLTPPSPEREPKLAPRAQSHTF
ncbi:hypothetical protein CGLO_10785 [Colletotrichum gloeosporioides Cg-14]|uniref:Uncharacterized protein n=1 Tax=Colletotrichum gloeosporioides (strain Cg-14) TaxID=1237896 RepID=T0K2I1_COLGC|nr:hypothetical protein CGLO_10785 [Colletotrichum gloeosporioides Cg-14]